VSKLSLHFVVLHQQIDIFLKYKKYEKLIVDKKSGIITALVLTNEFFIENIAMLAPLGKSDHSVLSIDCTLQTDVVQKVIKHNYNKGNYEGMRQSSQINWKELLLPLHNDIDTMWLTFKQ